MAMKGPLSGVRVIDLSQGYGGPFAGQILGDMGAEVTKIEPPIGEVARVDIWGKSGGPDILALNRNKKGIVLDLWSDSGREAFYDLVKVSDVLLDNLRKGALETIGADYESLKRINPRIISASIVGYGSSGPYSDYPPYEHIAEAINGMAAACGNPGEKPIVQPMPLAELSSAIYLDSGIMAALLERERTGGGRRVEVNLLHGGMKFEAAWLLFCFMGLDTQPSDRRSQVPIMGFYRAGDGDYLALGVSWPRIARVLDMEWMIDDPRFATTMDQFMRMQELHDVLEEGFQKAGVKEWLDLLRVHDIPSSPIYTLDEVVEDAQVIHNKTVISMEHPEYGKMRAIGCPIKVIGATQGEHAPPPTLGQHTEEVLKSILGYSDEKIARIKREQEENFEEMQKQAREVI